MSRKKLKCILIRYIFLSWSYSVLVMQVGRILVRCDMFDFETRYRGNINEIAAIVLGTERHDDAHQMHLNFSTISVL